MNFELEILNFCSVVFWLTFTALKQKAYRTIRTTKLREMLYSADTNPAAAEIQTC